MDVREWSRRTAGTKLLLRFIHVTLIELRHQDFHLAKRHYDLAYETNSEAYLPVLLSLGKLYIHSIWHTLMGGEDGLNIWYPEDEETSEF